jgi:hypothetical protein
MTFMVLAVLIFIVLPVASMGLLVYLTRHQHFERYAPQSVAADPLFGTYVITTYDEDGYDTYVYGVFDTLDEALTFYNKNGVVSDPAARLIDGDCNDHTPKVDRV